jgi:putative transposase
MDRFKSPVIHTESNLISVMRYVDLNPLRAKMVKHPKNYKWCSYNYYANGLCDDLITESPAYKELGLDKNERQVNYTSIMEHLINTPEGKKRTNYSTTFFIGEPAWVKNQYNLLKEKTKLKFEQKNNINT